MILSGPLKTGQFAHSIDSRHHSQISYTTLAYKFKSSFPFYIVVQILPKLHQIRPGLTDCGALGKIILEGPQIKVKTKKKKKKKKATPTSGPNPTQKKKNTNPNTPEKKPRKT